MKDSEYAQMYALEKEFWWYKGLHELVETFLRQHSRGQGRCEMLDAGCGTGRMMQVASRYGTVHGMDHAREAVLFCAKNDLENVSCQDLNTWEPEAGRYDMVISLDVLYHAGVHDDAHVVRKFHQALKDDGLCIVNLPAFPVLFRNHDLAVHTKRRYRKKAAVRMFENAGFVIHLATYRLPHLFLVILAKKAVQYFFGPQDKSDLQELPAWLNTCLFRMAQAENRLITSGVPMPFGSSLFLVAGKQR